MEFEQALFCSKIRREEREKLEHNKVSGLELATTFLKYDARTLTGFPSFPTEFRAKERLLAVYLIENLVVKLHTARVTSENINL